MDVCLCVYTMCMKKLCIYFKTLFDTHRTMPHGEGKEDENNNEGSHSEQNDTNAGCKLKRCFATGYPYKTFYDDKRTSVVVAQTQK